MLHKYNRRKALNRARIRYFNFEVIKACKGSLSRQTIKKNQKDKKKYRPKRLIKEIYKLRKNKKLRKQRKENALKEVIKEIKDRFRSIKHEPILYNDTSYQVIWKQIENIGSDHY